MVDIFIKVSPRKLTRRKGIMQINKGIFSMSEYIIMLFTGQEVFNGEKLCWRSRVQRKASGLRWYSRPRAQFFSYGLIYICKPVNYLFIFSTGFSFFCCAADGGEQGLDSVGCVVLWVVMVNSPICLLN